MKEMTPLEAAEILESKYNIHGPVEIVTKELEARAMAASFLRKIANREIREVVHGEWVEVKGQEFVFDECTVCGKRIAQYTKNETNYCPRCGAKMGDCHE